MDFRFTPEQEAFRQEVRDFIIKELPPRLAVGEEPYSDENFEATMAFRRKLGQKKYIGIGWPKEYGGLGASIMMQMIFHEEMLYRHAPLDPQAYQVGPALIFNGSDYLKKKFLAATANQDIVWCVGFSEPNSGSDLASLQTQAVEDGDDFVINGQKIWTSNAHRADYIHMLTRTDPNVPKHRGISYFVLDMKTPGVTIQPIIDMANGHHVNQVFFDNVRVPKENMIGEKNMGWYVATTTLDNERTGIRDVTGARRRLDDILRALLERKGVSGIHLDPVAIHKLADLRVQVETSKMLSYRVGWMQDRGLQPNKEASMAKVFGTELQQRIARVSMELLGLYSQLMPGSKYAVLNGTFGSGYMRTIPGTIAGGTSEVNRNIIATRGLGLPRGY